MFEYVLPFCVLKPGWPTWLNLISEFLKASIFVNKSKNNKKKVKHSNHYIKLYFALLVTLMFPLPNHLFKGFR